MPASLINSASGPVTYKVFSEGQDLSSVCTIISFVVTKNVNRVSSATIQLYDGGIPTASTFDASNAGIFDPGKAIEIKVGYSSKEDTIFKGIVVRHGMSVTSKGEFTLKIECKDEAVKLTVGRKSALFLEKTDSDIITEITSQYSGLTPTVDSTSYVNPELIQNYTTDWDFIIQRAELNGLVVLTSDNEFTVTAPQIGAPVLKVSPETGIMSFNAFVDARNQLSKVKTASWDRENQEVLSNESSSAPSDVGGKFTPSQLAGIIGLDAYNLQTTSSIPSEMLQSWALGKHTKSGYSKIQGSFTIWGSSLVNPGDTIELEGFSDQFNGKIYVGGVEHLVEGGSFTTRIEIGISPNFFNEEKLDISAAPTSGLLSPIKGLHIGVVEQIHEDPNGEFRIKVKLPTLQVDNLSVWARQANFYSTAEAGLFFYPEVNDEVIVGFLNEDPQSPIVLGALYNKNNSVTPYQPAEENYIKAIVTKAKLTIEFDEENNAITLKTPDENTVILSDDKQNGEAYIKIADKNDNVVEMTSKGISIKSAKDIKIEADGDIVFKSKNGKIDGQASSGDVTLKGMNVSVSADSQMTVKGNSTTNVESSGQTVVKGATVSIN